MTETTEWLPAIAIFAGGLILGVMFIFYTRGRKSRPLVAANELEAERDSLLQQLRDLNPDATEERKRLELEAAAVLRKLDQRGKSEAASAPAFAAPVAAVASQPNAALRGFLWGVGSFAALALLAYFVMKSSTPRGEGESAVGGGPPGAAQPMQQPQAQGQADPALQAMEARVQANPEDLGARVDLSKAYLERDDFMKVFEQTQYVLEKNPGEPRALTYQALVRVAMGEVDNATRMLQTATKNDPTLLDGWVSLAWVYAQSGKMADAEKAMASAKQQHPEEAVRLDQVFTQMKAQIAQQKQEPPPNHPAVPPPPTEAAAATPVPAPPSAPTGSASGDAVRVSLEFAPSASGKNGIVYVIVRAAGVQSGAPVAVKRLMAAQLPTTIDLSQSDSMMGQPLPQKMRVEARLDTDGDVTTKNADDPFAAQDGVVVGSTIKLALK
ncbi:MAG TPA: hypothetical protein VMU84_21725 [Thermoanaerobaculia bacterium]|nr:hypothetical protein [Thermoanaerobaculia bacterium]